jgi:hypothetical protein
MEKLAKEDFGLHNLEEQNWDQCLDGKRLQWSNVALVSKCLNSSLETFHQVRYEIWRSFGIFIGRSPSIWCLLAIYYFGPLHIFKAVKSLTHGIQKEITTAAQSEHRSSLVIQVDGAENILVCKVYEMLPAFLFINYWIAFIIAWLFSRPIIELCRSVRNDILVGLHFVLCENDSLALLLNAFPREMQMIRSSWIQELLKLPARKPGD